MKYRQFENDDINNFIKHKCTFFISTPVITEDNKDKVLKPKICIDLNDIENLKKDLLVMSM